MLYNTLVIYMKKLLKKIEIKPLLISTFLVLFQSFCYFISKLLEGDLNLIGGVLDSKIPFNIYFIIPYAFWYFMLFIIPYYLYVKKDKESFIKYFISYILVVIVSNIIFVIYPTTVIRPEVSGSNILELMTRLIFYIDTPIQNCFPSLHCAMSMLWLLFILDSKKSSTSFKIWVPIVSILIMLSTLFVKQHVIIDLISGDVIALIVYIIIKYENKLTNKCKKILKEDYKK